MFWRFVTRVAAAVSLLTTALVFDAARWPTYIAANILIALTYAMIGALFGRVGGLPRLRVRETA